MKGKDKLEEKAFDFFIRYKTLICLEEAEKRIEASKILLSEGYYKDAVSRAYYSMYYASKALLSMKGIQTKTHEGLASKIGELAIKGVIEREYGKILTKAKDMRGTADYGMYKEISMEEEDI